MAEETNPITNNPAENQSQNSDSGNYIQRRSQWRSSLDALAYIHRLSKQPQLKIRDSDRMTGLAVILASIATVLCLLLHKLNGLGLQLTLLCDFFLGTSLILYVFNRLGILTGMTPRQAMLSWQLIRAFCFVGVFITVNLALIFTLALSLAPMSTIGTQRFISVPH